MSERTTAAPAKPRVTLQRRGDNVSFIAEGPFGPVRIITRPGDQAAGTGRALDAVFVGHADYAALVAAEFANHGVTVTAAEIEAALK